MYTLLGRLLLQHLEESPQLSRPNSSSLAHLVLLRESYKKGQITEDEYERLLDLPGPGDPSSKQANPSGKRQSRRAGSVTSIANPYQRWLAANIMGDVDLGVLYRFFDEGTIAVLLTALLANVSLLFVARDDVSANCLTEVQEALMSLLAPLGWENPYIPYVPIGIIQARPGYLGSPGCMVMGFSLAEHRQPTSTLAEDLAALLPHEDTLSPDTVLVDLTQGHVLNLPTWFPLLPTSTCKLLLLALEKFRRTLHSGGKVDAAMKQTVKNTEDRNRFEGSGEESSSSEDSSDSSQLDNNANDWWSDYQRTSMDAIELRAAVSYILLDLIGDVRPFIAPKKSPKRSSRRTPHFDFDWQAYLDSFSVHGERNNFMEYVVNGQGFDTLINSMLWEAERKSRRNAAASR